MISPTERAMVILLSKVPAALIFDTKKEALVPNWRVLGDDLALGALSSGEQARVWLAFQLYNGANPFPEDRWTLHKAIGCLDADGKDDLDEAVGEMFARSHR